MPVMEWTSLGWRDVILLLAVIAAVYLAVMLLRLTRLGGRRQAPPEERAPPELPRADAAEAEAPAAAFTVLPAPTFAWDEVEELLGETAPVNPAAQPAVARPGGFGEHLAEHLARSDMEMEVQRMRDEMARMRAELEEMRMARRVSPQYAEAMELAQRGLTAQDVADRLGISLAEAELVHALSRGEMNFEEGEDHGEDGYATDGFGGRRAG